MTGTLLTILLLSQTAAPELTWQPSFSQAKIVAEKGSKPILVSFHTSWCGWCRKMDRITFRDPKVIARLATHVVLFSVDAEKDEDGVALAREHRIGSYPTQLLLDGTGSEIGRLSGYKDPLAFVRELDIVMAARLRLTRLLEEEAASPDDPRLLFELAMTLERGHRFPGDCRAPSAGSTEPCPGPAVWAGRLGRQRRPTQRTRAARRCRS